MSSEPATPPTGGALRPPRAPSALAAATATALAVLAACGSGCGDRPAAPGDGPVPARRVAGVWSTRLAALTTPPGGAHVWTWRGDGREGVAALDVSGRTWTWTLTSTDGDTALPALVELAPADSLAWHSFRARADSAGPAEWLPLPRIPVRSPCYADLLQLVQDLTAPVFGAVVVRWAPWPVPVHSGPAVSGEVDLRACLRDAVDAWDVDGEDPFLVWRPDAVDGVRLVHYPGVELRPPMSARLVRRDADGRILRVHIRCGDNYATAVDIPYARRVFVHELAHALLLWGHSRDRAHVLWENGPVVDRPAADERRAVALWRALPEGADLTRYGRSGELDPDR